LIVPVVLGTLLPAHAFDDAVADFAGEVRLTLPHTIYATTSVETNLYVDNVVLVVNPANYVFDVTCEKRASITTTAGISRRQRKMRASMSWSVRYATSATRL